MSNQPAEQAYLKEFVNFSVNNRHQGVIHYNDIEEHEARDYLKKIKDLHYDFKYEIETKVAYLIKSKPQLLKYLEQTIEKLLTAVDKLDWYEEDTRVYDIFTDEIEEGEFHRVLWNKHFDLTNNLIDLCQEYVKKLNAEPKTGRGRKRIHTDKIGWLKGAQELSYLFYYLKQNHRIPDTEKHYIFISEISLREFDKHFIEGSGEPTKKINWSSEKYLLTHLFDELSKYNFLNEKFASNKDLFLSNHFTVKGNHSPKGYFASARRTFKKSVAVGLSKDDPKLKISDGITDFVNRHAERIRKK